MVEKARTDNKGAHRPKLKAELYEWMEQIGDQHQATVALERNGIARTLQHTKNQNKTLSGVRSNKSGGLLVSGKIHLSIYLCREYHAHIDRACQYKHF